MSTKKKVKINKLKHKKKRPFNIFFLLSFLSLFGAIIYGALYTKEIIDYKNAEKSDTEILSVAKSPNKDLHESTDKNALVNPINWEELKKEAPNVIAWIQIPGTKIDYPILQGEDNDFYLNANYKDEWDILGSIFLDYRQSKDFSALNTILYGHNVDLNNPSPKFGELSKYYDKDFLEKHKTIYIYTPEDIYIGEVFAVHKDSANSDSQNIDIYTKKELIAHAKFMQDNSEVKTYFDVNSVERIITLWSCAMEETISTRGQYVNPDKARTFVSVSIQRY